ncbi:hypothetical protein MNBD_UNCLBAC01-1119 [hydrothermal vent metagenome]|uniref:O-antigen ligase-related domain-containing protein n=1 Tax=hydrothermal vent metagenome TaxID=652676 RepID=A0A3B1E245_9ZZZZ
MSSQKLLVFYDRSMLFSFCALIYFLPISIALVEIFSGFALFFYLLKRGTLFWKNIQNNTQEWTSLSFGKKCLKFLQIFKPITNDLTKPITVFLAVCFISIFPSQYFHVGLIGFLGKLLQSAFVYFTFLECINTKKRLKIFLTAFFLSFTLISINGLFQSITGEGFIHGHLEEPDTRIRSSLRSTNDFGAYLVMAIPIFSFMLISIKSFFKKTPLILLVCIALLCLGLTYSRGAWVAFILCFFWGGLKNKKILWYFGIIFIIFTLLFIPKMIKNRTDNSPSFIINGFHESIETASAVVKKTNTPNNEKLSAWKQKTLFFKTFTKRFFYYIDYYIRVKGNRIPYWETAWKIFKTRPLLGIGFNNYSLVSINTGLPWGGYPHNCYLQLLAETGILGLSAFLWLIISIFKNTKQKLLALDDPFLKFLFIGTLTGLLGFFINIFVDTHFYSVQLSVLMWLLMGISAAIPIIQTSSKKTILQKK